MDKAYRKITLEPLRWLRKSADQNATHAESALGYMYFKGEGVPQDDVQAIAWYRKAADQGLPLAQQSLASMYFKGQGLQRDYAQALAWYEKAAEQGDAVSQATSSYIVWVFVSTGCCPTPSWFSKGGFLENRRPKTKSPAHQAGLLNNPGRGVASVAAGRS
jgi:hypothetical protein